MGTALKLHYCNALTFAVLEANNAIRTQSAVLVCTEILTFALFGLLLPIYVTWHNELQSRQIFVSKSRHLCPAHIGRFWLRHISTTAER